MTLLCLVGYTAAIIRAEENPNVLAAFFAGVLIPDIEKLPDDVITNGIYFLTQKFIGDKFNVTKPDQIIHSSWRSNPHFKGTYSFQTPSAVRGNNLTNAEEDLAEPIKNNYGKPIVQFAGEATHSYYYSNVQGATESGLREGERIVQYYK